jgi:hemoglobin/transferrin/lactoferrin receptor protein
VVSSCFFSRSPVVVSNAFAATRLACGLALAYVSLASAQAQAVPPGAVASLKEMVVSGSRADQDSDDIPATIEVIGAEQLEAGQIRDIRGLVKDLPNVSVKRAPARFTLAGSGTGREGNAGFNIRGLDGNRVLILTDGLRAPRSYVFNVTSFGRDYVDVTLLKRVEIVKGPASALYGSDGLAGLVNFITREPQDYLKDGKTIGDKTIGGTAAASYSGEDKGFGLSATVAGQGSDTVQWLLSANVSAARALDNRGSNDAANVDRTTPNPQQDRGRGLLGKVIVTPSSTQRHALTLEHVEKRSAYELLTAVSKPPLVATSTLYSDSFATLNRDRVTWDARYQIDAALADRLQTVVSWQKADSREYTFEDRNTAADRVRDVTYAEKTLQLGVQADKLIRAAPGGTWAQKITYGADTTRADIENLNNGVTPPAGETFPLKRFPDTRETSAALYLQSEFISDALSITPALRYDSYRIQASQAGFSPPSATPAASLSGSAVSPKLGAVWRASAVWSVFGNLASGFRAPNASQVNAFFESPIQFYRTIPNPNLKPETSRNLELGARARYSALQLDVAAFTGRYKDLIVDSQQVGGAGVVSNPTVFQSVNVGNATVYGFEVKGRYNWGRFANGVVTTPFTFGMAKGKDKATSKPLNSIDPAKLTAGVAYSTGPYDLRLDASHHAAKKGSDIDSAGLVTAPAQQFEIPSATTLDLSGQWRIRKDLRLNLALNNLTNKKYWNWSDVRGLSSASTITDSYTQPGRNLAVSLVADF